MKKILIFGAGKIGRSFIGQIFSRSGYEVVFVDISEAVISALNKEKSYEVHFVSECREEIIMVENVRGIHASDTQDIIREITQTDLVASCVGKNGLSYIIPTLAKGIQKRHRSSPQRPLDFIIAENMREAGHHVKTALLRELPENFPISDYVGLVETSIGKMVPDLSKTGLGKSILTVYAEPYNTLIADKKGFRSDIPDIVWLQTKENMKAWVDRKLFIHNFGHACAAYAGHYHYPELTHIYQVLNKQDMYDFVKEAMLQSAAILLRHYPDEFSNQQLQAHIEDLLLRFQNKKLGDSIFRVGCDLYRKLQPDDRLMTPFHTGFTHSMDIRIIGKTIAYAMFFRATDYQGQMHPTDKQFVRELKEKGTSHILKQVCGANPQELSFLLEEINNLSIHSDIKITTP